ncbi:MAG: hypothetical protein ACXABN_10010 [Candidatus Thorarchaeota archaeon]
MRIKPLSEDFIGTIVESKSMVSRSLEKMMLIAIGLSTAVIVGVPILMYSIDTINTTTHLQEAELAAEQIHNATMLVDSGSTNSTSITVWIRPGTTVTATGTTLTILYSEGVGSLQTWPATYNHDIVIDDPLNTHQAVTPYTVEVVIVDNVIHISFDAVPI